MYLTKRIFALSLLLAVAGLGSPLNGQWGRAGGGLGLYGYGPRLGENVQLALDLQERLGLSAAQVSSLQDLQAGIRHDVAPVEAAIADLRNGILAGDVDQSDGLARLQLLLANFEEVAAPYRTEVAGVLTPDQHRSLQAILLTSRPVPGAEWGMGAGTGLGLRSGVAPPAAALGVRPLGGRGLGVGYGRGGGVGRGYYGYGFNRSPRRGLGRRWGGF